MSSGDTAAAAATRALMSFKRASRVSFGRPLDESEIESNQIVAVMHADKRGRVQKTALRQFEDELVKIFRRHTKRVHQRGLNGSGYFCHPSGRNGLQGRESSQAA